MNSSVCPDCQRPIPQNAPAGLCPNCLLAEGQQTPDESPRSGHRVHSGAFAVTTPQSSRDQGHVTVPDAEQTARHFPQLEGLELIGRGGMGAVYKARQKKLDRFVAVKIIRPDTTADPAFAERFLREARTLARLSHPNIVAVHDFGEIASSDSKDPAAPEREPGTLFYFIMEFVDGANLRQLMQSGQLSPELAVSIVPQICEALQYAHEEGVVHRDIKPENIMLDSRGRVKIADFGLAKLSGRTIDDWTLTGTHQVMGTPRYMAPEQLAGSRNVDHRADIYSLGVVFYEMLTGHIPVGHFAPPSQRSKVDARLDAVVLKAMASEPDLRFQTARDLQSGVQQISSPSVMGPQQTGYSDSVAADDSPSRTGFSTIMDREVLAAWRLVAGEPGPQGTESSRGPILLLLLLCAIGMGSLALPWFSVDLGNSAESAKSVPTRIIKGSDLRTGIAAAVAFDLSALCWLVIPSRHRMRASIAGLVAFLSAVALMFLLLSVREIAAIRGEAAGEIPGSFYRFMPGFFVPVSTASLLTLLGIAALSRSLQRRNSDRPESAARADSVTISKHAAENDLLPDLCMVCGNHTTERVYSTVSFQKNWAQALMLLGFIFGGIPGVIIAMLTTRETQITCPLCPDHRNHWSRLTLFASLGWLLPIVLGALGFLAAYLPAGSLNHRSAASIYMPVIGIVLGLLVYLIPVIYMGCTNIVCNQLSDTAITFSRVSSAFAAKVRQQRSAAAKA